MQSSTNNNNDHSIPDSLDLSDDDALKFIKFHNPDRSLFLNKSDARDLLKIMNDFKWSWWSANSIISALSEISLRLWRTSIQFDRDYHYSYHTMDIPFRGSLIQIQFKRVERPETFLFWPKIKGAIEREQNKTTMKLDGIPVNSVNDIKTIAIALVQSYHDEWQKAQEEERQKTIAKNATIDEQNKLVKERLNKLLPENK